GALPGSGPASAAGNAGPAALVSGGRRCPERAGAAIPPDLAAGRTARSDAPHPRRGAGGRRDLRSVFAGVPALPAGGGTALAAAADHRRPGALLHGGHAARPVATVSLPV